MITNSLISANSLNKNISNYPESANIISENKQKQSFMHLLAEFDFLSIFLSLTCYHTSYEMFEETFSVKLVKVSFGLLKRISVFLFFYEACNRAFASHLHAAVITAIVFFTKH
jgi:hypothetical protein